MDIVPASCLAVIDIFLVWLEFHIADWTLALNGLPFWITRYLFNFNERGRRCVVEYFTELRGEVGLLVCKGIRDFEDLVNDLDISLV